MLLTVPNPEVKARTLLELKLGISRGNFFGGLKTGGGPWRNGERGKLRGDPNSVAIYVENADVTLTSLVVSGLVDPSAVE